MQKMKRKREEKKEQEREEMHQLVMQRLRAPPGKRKKYLSELLDEKVSNNNKVVEVEKS
jgi:hypothetical protein